MARSAHSDVLEQIGRRIADGNLAPGTVMTLAELETDYQASRTVIREAVRVLESIGMVASKRRVGITVRPMSNWDSFDGHLIRWNLTGPRRQSQLDTIMELRAAVEPMAARLAATRASHADGDELVRLAVEMKTLGQQARGASERYLADDVAFHSLILAASGNAMFGTLTRPICETLRGRVEAGLMPETPVEGSLEGHVNTALAIQSRDQDGAGRHMGELIDAIQQEITNG